MLRYECDTSSRIWRNHQLKCVQCFVCFYGVSHRGRVFVITYLAQGMCFNIVRCQDTTLCLQFDPRDARFISPIVKTVRSSFKTNKYLRTQHMVQSVNNWKCVKSCDIYFVLCYKRFMVLVVLEAVQPKSAVRFKRFTALFMRTGCKVYCHSVVSMLKWMSL